MNWLYGISMAISMFTFIPWPFNLWSEKARGHCLACFPVVGIITGAVWAGTAYIVSPLPSAIAAVILAAMPWFITGGIHIDGYMDVCDAIGSRREKSRAVEILKDPHCGSFAVLGMVLLAMAQWSVFYSMENINYLLLGGIPVSVRACASILVLTLPAIEKSQYTSVEKSRIFLIFPGLVLIISIVLPVILFNSFVCLLTAFVYTVSAVYCSRVLGGMNGDISGFSLVIAELFGALYLCVL